MAVHPKDNSEIFILGENTQAGNGTFQWVIFLFSLM
jgi:hypothetical protein